MSRWGQAHQLLNDFLEECSINSLLSDAVMDLRELADAMPAIADRLVLFQEQLEGAWQSSG